MDSHIFHAHSIADFKEHRIKICHCINCLKAEVFPLFHHRANAICDPTNEGLIYFYTVDISKRFADIASARSSSRHSKNLPFYFRKNTGASRNNDRVVISITIAWNIQCNRPSERFHRFLAVIVTFIRDTSKGFSSSASTAFCNSSRTWSGIFSIWALILPSRMPCNAYFNSLWRRD